MKKFLLASSAFIALTAMAQAADLPSIKGPAPTYAAPIFTWSGLYVGLNAGYAHTFNTTTDVDYKSFGGSRETNGNSFTGGAEIGWNWQMGALVYGLEADISFLSSSQKQSGLWDSFYHKADYIGTVRSRTGLALDRALVYVTGGLAYANLKNGWATADAGLNAKNPTVDNFSTSGTRFGFVLGAGVEYAFAPNWSLKTEALYANFGNNTTSCAIADCRTTTGTNPFHARFENSAVILRTGLNYKFF